MRNKIDEYIGLLNKFYDLKFLFKGLKGKYEGILTLNNSVIVLKEPYKINEAMIKYRRDPGEGCKKCEKTFKKVIKLQTLIFNYLNSNPNGTKKYVYDHIKKNFPHIKDKDSNFGMAYTNIKSEFKKKKPQFPDYNIKFYERPMEFPGFYKSLDLSKDHVKNIMIIGEAAGPDIATHINCTYGLSNTDINDKGRIVTKRIFKKLKECSPKLGESLNLLKVGKKELKGLDPDEQIEKFRKNLHNNLWQLLNCILPISSEVLKRKVYVTDLVKCNAKGNDIWKHFTKKCFESFLIHEISIINPKLIIFLGNTGYDYLKKKFEFDECCPSDNNCSFSEHPEYSKYKIYNFRDDKYLKIYYERIASLENKERNFSNKPFSEFNQEDKEVLIKKLNIPRRFPTFGTIIFKYKSTIVPIKFVKIFHNSDQNKIKWEVYTKVYKDFFNNLVEDKIIPL